MRPEKLKKQKTGNEQFSSIEKLHPHKTLLFFALLGSSLLFMSISFLFLVSISRQSPLQHFVLSKWFFIGSLALLISSFSLSGIKNAFKNDHYAAIRQKLIFTLVMGSVFIFCQLAGWYEMLRSGFEIHAHPLLSFFYILSGIHLLHALAGQAVISVILIHASRQNSDPVKSLIYFSNPIHCLRLEMSVIFWHFVDFLWLALFIMFLFTLG
ncbi:MAG: cytochrome c oxidase subunit 3 [Bacteroidia bacterium]|nr:cytochrome c oxidase subunit 3 [Bacteroidia bacterium]